MKSVLSVFNICGISRRQNVAFYIKAIDSLLRQKFDGKHDIVISSCLSTDDTKRILLECYSGKVSFNFIEDKLPVNVTFNDTVLRTVEKYGEYDGYLYIDSGCSFDGDLYTVDKLYKAFKSDNFGLMSARTDTDTGYREVFKVVRDDDLFTESIFYVPVGKAVNLHVFLYHNDWLKYYRRLMPDIFSSYCSESVFSFIVAGINKKWGIFGDLVIPHLPMMDGQSAGFSPNAWSAVHGNCIDHPFIVDSVLKIMQHPDAIRYGLGYEEMQEVVMHDKSQFDDNGYCTNGQLKEYIKDNLYLSEELFDYNSINTTYIGITE